MGNVVVVRCLIEELGAQVDRVGEDGSSPVYIAAQEGMLDVVICLVKEFGADAKQPNKFGITPMCVAALHGHQDVVRVQVRDFGADLNHAAKDGSTALMAASHRKHTDPVKWMVKEGADPLKATADGSIAVAFSKANGASAERTAYLEAKTHCSNTGCSGAGIMKCTGCKQARYCGGQCQLAHWKAHKTDCKRWSAEAKAGKGN
jgi:ankyrin repeat protein